MCGEKREKETERKNEICMQMYYKEKEVCVCESEENGSFLLHEWERARAQNEFPLDKKSTTAVYRLLLPLHWQSRVVSIKIRSPYVACLRGSCWMTPATAKIVFVSNKWKNNWILREWEMRTRSCTFERPSSSWRLGRRRSTPPMKSSGSSSGRTRSTRFR